MIRKYNKGERGITLIALVFTIVILLILATAVAYSINSSNNPTYYNNMISDIGQLEDAILVYYNEYGELPITERKVTIEAQDYYEIDLSKLENVTLFYGSEFGKDLNSNSDIYVVNNALEVYYLKGIERNGEVYHKINK